MRGHLIGSGVGAKFAAGPFQRLDGKPSDFGTITIRLPSQSFEQFTSRNAGKSRMIVALGNGRGPAASRIRNQNASSVARKIDCGSQSGRATANDQTFPGRRHGCQAQRERTTCAVAVSICSP